MRKIRNIIISGVLLCDIGSAEPPIQRPPPIEIPRTPNSTDSTAAPDTSFKHNKMYYETATGQSQPKEKSIPPRTPQSADFVTPKSTPQSAEFVTPKTAPKATVTEKVKEAVVSVTGAVKGAAVHVVKKGIQQMEKEKGPCPGPFRVSCTRESSETMDWNCEITTQNWGQKDGAPYNCQTFGKAEYGTKQELQEKFLKCGGIWTHKPQGTTTTKYYTGIDAEKGVLGYGNPNKIEIARGPLCKAKIH